MVLGRCGSIKSQPSRTDSEMGEQPVALRAEELDGLIFYQAERDELVEGFADLADQRTACHGADDVIGQAPAELLGYFVALGLGSLCVVRAQVDVDEARTGTRLR